MEIREFENLRETNEVSLKDVLLSIGGWYRFILTKWIFIIAFGIFGGALGLIYSIIKQPIYTATTTFVLEEGNSGGSGGLGSLGGLASMVGVEIGSGGGIFQGDNILELYKSRSMIEETLLTEVLLDGKREKLVDRYIDFNKLREKWDKKKELKNIEFNTTRTQNLRPDLSRLQDSILGTIVKDIKTNYLLVIKPDKKLAIIKASVKATDELFAKAFNDQIVKNVNDFYVQTKTKKSIANISILQQKTDSVRNVMNGAIYTAANISDATPNLNPTRQVQRVAPVQRSQFTAETNKGVLAELVKNLELSKISLRKETPLIQVIDSPIMPLDKVFISKLKGSVIGFVFGALFIIVIIVSIRFFRTTLN